MPRLLAALVIGGAIGWERQSRHKPAGLRTQVVQGILAGIGFIGAGTILRQGTSVVGLTTAGTIWMAAALGIVVGAGFYVLAAAGVILSFVVVDVIGWIERRPAKDDLIEELEARTRDLRQRDEIIAALTQRQPAASPQESDSTAKDD